MDRVAIIEHGKVTYHGLLPDKFKNSNMNVTGLRNSEGNWESLNAKGIFTLEEITPKYNKATYKIDGFTFDIQVDKVVKTLNIRERTKKELDRITLSQNNHKIELRIRELAIESLKASGELPKDYKGKES